jgi:putative transposase
MLSPTSSSRITLLVRKSIKQRMVITTREDASTIQRLMESFRAMCNDAIRIGLAADASSLKRLSNLTYSSFKEYEVPSYYKLCAISKAAGILAARKKSIKRGYTTRRPYLSRPLLVSCYGFKIDDDGVLLIPLGDRDFARIALNAHTREIISLPGVKVRSFTMTEDGLSLCIAKDIDEEDEGKTVIRGTVGIDRNLRNVAVGNEERVTYYDVSKNVEIAENTRSIVRSFKRDDVRTRREIASKYGKRRQERTRQILNNVSRRIVSEARRSNQAIVFEDITGIRKLYRKGNGQGKQYRGRMNSWPFGELKRQVEYKAAWEGVPVVTLSVKETRGTTMDCARCGERVQAPIQCDRGHYRQLWCEGCKRWEDRDLCAVLNISRRGRLRFDRSSSPTAECEAREAVKGNQTTTPAILRVDASKLCHAQKTQ